MFFFFTSRHPKWLTFTFIYCSIILYYTIYLYWFLVCIWTGFALYLYLRYISNRYTEFILSQNQMFVYPFHWHRFVNRIDLNCKVGVFKSKLIYFRCSSYSTVFLNWKSYIGVYYFVSCKIFFDGNEIKWFKSSD